MALLRQFLSVTLLSLLPVVTIYAQVNGSIGRVLVTQGTVTARDPINSSRPLRRGSELAVGDTLMTETKGFAQIRLIDGAQISLDENSEFVIKEYDFDNDPATPDKVILELIQGGFRTITGSVSEDENDIYLFSTPDLDVSVTGTTYECAIEQTTSYCGVYDGGINISNQAGSFDLGLGGNWDYIQVEDRQSSPVPLLTAPMALAQSNAYNGGTNSSAGNMQQASPSATKTATGLTNSASFPAPKPTVVSPYKKP